MNLENSLRQIEPDDSDGLHSTAPRPDVPDDDTSEMLVRWRSFDNVGGETLEAGIAHIARFGRIVLCGAIAGYNDATPAPGPRNLMRLISQRAEMRGFILLDHLAAVPAARAELEPWLRTGNIRYRTDVQRGFDAIPETFLRLFSSASQGKQLLRIDEDKLADAGMQGCRDAGMQERWPPGRVQHAADGERVWTT